MNNKKITPAKLTPLISLIRKKDEGDVPRGKLSTFGKIQEKYGGMPPLRSEEGKLNVEVLIDLYWMFAQEEDPNITFEEVEASLTIDKMLEATRMVTEKLRINLPESLMRSIQAEKELLPDETVTVENSSENPQI